MKKILILSTGGTFNKIYQPITGTLEIDPDARALHAIGAHWQSTYPIQTLIHKDSLEMDADDRRELLAAIRDADEAAILVIHGTDTMDQSARLIAEARLQKQVVFTGAMVPWSIDPVEATANVASGIGALQAGLTPGVYIAMNGVFGRHDQVVKDRQQGRFVAVG